MIQHCIILCSTLSCSTRVATFVDQQTVSLALSFKWDRLAIKLTPQRQKRGIMIWTSKRAYLVNFEFFSSEFWETLPLNLKYLRNIKQTLKQVRLEENAILTYTRNLSVLLHYSCVNITIRDRWSINGKLRFCTLLTVKGWSSTLPTATAALSSNVFVAPVSTWWSFILFSLHSPFIL